MKKLILTVTVVLSACGWAMTEFPDGTYAGNGRWKDSSGESGSYTVKTEIQKNVVNSLYQFAREERKWTFYANFDKQGFFPVEVEGKAVGSGYCQSVQCHYNATFGPMTLEETLTFVDGKLYRLGSKTISGVVIAWEEELESR